MIINHRKAVGKTRLVQLTNIVMNCWSMARSYPNGNFEIRFLMKDRSYSLCLNKEEALELHNELELHLNALGKFV